jgi:hypothetical protein
MREPGRDSATELGRRRALGDGGTRADVDPRRDGVMSGMYIVLLICCWLPDV